MEKVRLTARRIIAAAAVLAAALYFATAPPAPVVATLQTSDTPPAVRGAFHIHTRRSDGALDKAGIAAAAARAGLQFAVFTDHGNAVRAPDPPEYLHGVLCLDGVEISTSGGHYIAVGIPAAPYPLGGEAAAVAEDVRRLGGFGVAAHPLSPRAELAWQEWTAPIDGIEWLNADSEWRDEGRLRLTRALLDYLWRPAGALASLLDRSAELMRKWDELSTTRRIVAVAGHDAHGGLGAEDGSARGRRLHLPSYESVFRTFSLHVQVPRPFNADAAHDAGMLIDALRRGHAFTAIDSLAAPAALQLTARAQDGSTAAAGDELRVGAGRARFAVRASTPPGATTVLLRNGRPIAEAAGGTLDYEAALPGTYRAEVLVPNAPGSPPIQWLVSNPIYRFSHEEPETSPPPMEEGRRIDAAWSTEIGPGSKAAIVNTPEGVTMTYALGEEAASSPFVALATALELSEKDGEVLTFLGRADRPARVSVQLRFDRDANARWGRSVYLDQEPRRISVDLATLHASGSPAPRPALDRATSLLLVVDLVNALPGAKGSFSIERIALARR
jgi:hypothetical protein